MNSLDIIIKNKLWSLLKENGSLDETLINHIFYNSKIDLLEQIKTEDILKNMFERLLNTTIELKNEKKLFNYLLKELGSDYVKKEIQKQNSFIITYNWAKRQKNKTKFFNNLLNYIPEINNGLLLYVSILVKNNELINYAVINNKAKEFGMMLESYYLGDKFNSIKMNFITESSLKKEQKVFLLDKFNCNEEEVIDLFNKSLAEQDIVVLDWLLKNKKSELLNNKLKIYLPKSLTLETENFIFNNILLFRENDYTMNKLFSLTMENNELIKTLEKFEKFNYTFNYHTKDIFEKFIDEKNYQEILRSNVLNKEEVIKKVWKLNLSIDDKLSFSKNLFKNEKLNTSDSLDILFEHIKMDNKEVLLHSDVFSYSYISLFMYFWKKDFDLGIFFARNIEKNELLKYKKQINEEDIKEFDLIYFTALLNDKKIEKRQKI